MPSIPSTRSLCALALMIGWTAVAAGQAPAGGPLTDALRAHVKGERFDVITSVRGLPLGVRNELQSMWESSTLDIAEPGAEFRGSGAKPNPQLPSRRLVAAGCSADHHCLVYYELAGRTPGWVAALFHWTPEATRLEAGGAVPAGLKSIDAVRNAILSASLRPADHW